MFELTVPDLYHHFSSVHPTKIYIIRHLVWILQLNYIFFGGGLYFIVTLVNDESLDRQTFTVPVTTVITGSRCNGHSTSGCHGDKSFCFHLIVFLPPANKIWGKVMFSHLCVILFTGGGGLHPKGSASGGVCIQGGLHPGEFGIPAPPLDTTGCGQRAGGTEPTGMHSCSTLMFAELSNEFLRNYFRFVLFYFNLIWHFTCLDLCPFKLFSL